MLHANPLGFIICHKQNFIGRKLGVRTMPLDSHGSQGRIEARHSKRMLLFSPLPQCYTNLCHFFVRHTQYTSVKERISCHKYGTQYMITYLCPYILLSKICHCELLRSLKHLKIQCPWGGKANNQENYTVLRRQVFFSFFFFGL